MDQSTDCELRPVAAESSARTASFDTVFPAGQSSRSSRARQHREPLLASGLHLQESYTAPHPPTSASAKTSTSRAHHQHAAVAHTATETTLRAYDRPPSPSRLGSFVDDGEMLRLSDSLQSELTSPVRVATSKDGRHHHAHGSEDLDLGHESRGGGSNLFTHSRRSSVAGPPPGLDWTLISLCVRLGALMLLVFWVLWDCIVDTKLRPSDDNFWLDSVLPLYRATGFFLLAYWMWGANVLVWRTYRINYIYLFGLHAHTSDTHRQIFSNATTLSIIFLVNFLFYFKTVRGDFPGWIPDGVWPVTMLILLVVLMMPWPGCGTPIKQWPLAFGEVLIAPFRPVKFLHVFIGDCMTSLVKPSIDVAYSLCFMGSGLFVVNTLTSENGRVCLDSWVLNKVITPILSAAPLWLRLLQCLRRYYDTRDRFPHMVNAGKYATAQSVVLLGVFHQSLSKGSGEERGIWITCLVASTMYSYLWDVFQDWGLGQKDHRRLRYDLMFPRKSFYYFAIGLDLFFRFMWALTLVPASADNPLGDWYVHSLNPVVAGCEILRRGVWAMIRVENEHLTQVTGYQGSTLDEPLSESFMDAEADNHDVQEQVDLTRRTSSCKLLAEIAVLVAIVLAVALASYFTH